MLSLTKWVYVKYHFIIVKMHLESSNSDQALKNLNAMCGVELILGLLYILPLFECAINSPKLFKVEIFCV
jgi:hypothetical protein